MLALSTVEGESRVEERATGVEEVLGNELVDPVVDEREGPNQLLRLSPDPAAVLVGEVEAVAAAFLESLHDDRLKLERLDELELLLIEAPPVRLRSLSSSVRRFVLALAVLVDASVAEVVDPTPS